jgi:glycosyltransferase involved in cell wall biosynthesis
MASVLSQKGDFEIEYIIVDNASSDNTLEIAESYRSRIDEYNNAGSANILSVTVISGRDDSMYEAINKGFSMATGNIYAWINSDDLYLPDAFEKVAYAFAEMPDVRWLKGITSYIDEDGGNYRPGKCYLYAQNLIKLGLYGREAYFIQQDSVFWRADLWRAAGGLNEAFLLAGDYELWMRFAEREPLYTLNFPVSCFRKVKGQLSENLSAYREEQKRIVRNRNLRMFLVRRYFTSLEPKLRDWLNFLVFRVLCPFDSLRFIDSNSKTLRMRNSFKYKV